MALSLLEKDKLITIEEFVRDNIKIIENIPFDETRSYDFQIDPIALKYRQTYNVAYNILIQLLQIIQREDSDEDEYER